MKKFIIATVQVIMILICLGLAICLFLCSIAVLDESIGISILLITCMIIVLYAGGFLLRKKEYDWGFDWLACALEPGCVLALVLLLFRIVYLGINFVITRYLMKRGRTWKEFIKENEYPKK